MGVRGRIDRAEYSRYKLVGSVATRSGYLFIGCHRDVIVSVCSQICYAKLHSFPKEPISLVVIIVAQQFGPRNKAMQAHVIQSYCFGFFLAWV